MKAPEIEIEIANFYHFCENITQIYKNINNSIEDVHIARYDSAAKLFRQKYGKDPEYFIVAPGQIQLFGGLLSQQNDYPSITFNLEQDIVILYSKVSTQTVHMVNQQSALYPELQLATDPNELKFSEDNQFMNLFLWGYKAALEGFKQKPVGLQIMIISNLQIKCGLNSSSAFVIAVCIMTLLGNNLLKFAKLEDILWKLKNVVNLPANLEDNFKQYFRQTNNFNHCWMGKISSDAEFFNPKKFVVQGQELQLPQGYCFVLVNSLIQPPRFMKQGGFFEQRQAELQLALAYIVKKLGMKCENIKSVGNLQKQLGYEIDDMINLVNEQFENETTPINKDSFLKFMEIPLTEIIGHLPHANDMVEEAKAFPLYNRLMYILQEQKFIKEVSQILNETSLPAKEIAKKIGEIMSLSQKNIFSNYQELIPQMKSLLTLVESHSSVLGCKIVGEKSNGCVLVLIETSKTKALIDDIQASYYQDKKNKLFLTDDLNFLVVPSFATTKGVVVFDPQYEIWL